MSSCFDAPKVQDGDFGCLPHELINDWSDDQAKKSIAYRMGKMPGSSQTKEGKRRKMHMIDEIYQAYKNRGDLHDFDDFLPTLAEILEDPGALDNAYYFAIPSSDEMLNFYYNIWFKHDMARAMEPLHGYGYDLSGKNFRKCPEDGSWARMISYEGIAINERQKSAEEARIIGQEDDQNIVYLGGGIPHLHLYMDGMRFRDITIFDKSFIPSEEEYNRLSKEYHSLTYYQEDLLTAAQAHGNLHHSFDCCIMDGVSSYLYPKKTVSDNGTIYYDSATIIQAIRSGLSFLREGGSLIFDLLMNFHGMLRVGTAQHWPDAEVMRTFGSYEEAIEEAEKIAYTCNSTIEHTHTTEVQPWGMTGIVFVIRNK